MFLEFWKRKQVTIQYKWDLTNFVSEEVKCVCVWMRVCVCVCVCVWCERDCVCVCV